MWAVVDFHACVSNSICVQIFLSQFTGHLSAHGHSFISRHALPVPPPLHEVSRYKPWHRRFASRWGLPPSSAPYTLRLQPTRPAIHPARHLDDLGLIEILKPALVTLLVPLAHLDGCELLVALLRLHAIAHEEEMLARTINTPPPPPPRPRRPMDPTRRHQRKPPWLVRQFPPTS